MQQCISAGQCYTDVLCAHRLRVALLLTHLVCEFGTAVSVLATLLDERKQRRVGVQQYLFFAATLATTLLMTVVNIFGFKKVSSFVIGRSPKVPSGAAVLPETMTWAKHDADDVQIGGPR